MTLRNNREKLFKWEWCTKYSYHARTVLGTFEVNVVIVSAALLNIHWLTGCAALPGEISSRVLQERLHHRSRLTTDSRLLHRMPAWQGEARVDLVYSPRLILHGGACWTQERSPPWVCRTGIQNRDVGGCPCSPLSEATQPSFSLYDSSPL